MRVDLPDPDFPEIVDPYGAEVGRAFEGRGGGEGGESESSQPEHGDISSGSASSPFFFFLAFSELPRDHMSSVGSRPSTLDSAFGGLDSAAFRSPIDALLLG